MCAGGGGVRVPMDVGLYLKMPGSGSISQIAGMLPWMLVSKLEVGKLMIPSLFKLREGVSFWEKSMNYTEIWVGKWGCICWLQLFIQLPFLITHKHFLLPISCYST